jgi:predicted nucleotide-binding protein (sugar kinase/HSP70/actin superfamily)
MPTIHFQDGLRRVQRELWDVAKKLGISHRQSDRAVEEAFEVQREITARLLEAGRNALRELESAGQMGVVMVARPYSLYDRGSNLNIPGKLRDVYGVNVIPMDFLDLDGADIRTVHSNMFWNYGRKILQAAQIVREKPNLHIIYMTNFRCGPDSYIKHYVGQTSGKPFLILQLDGHSTDAGAMTRCEAYLESKGFLRC